MPPASPFARFTQPGAMLVAGFAGAIAVWCVWFAAPLPWVGLSDSVAIVGIGLAWLIALTLAFRLTRSGSNFADGFGAGLISGLICLIPLASSMRPSGEGGTPLATPLPSHGWQSALAFLFLGGTVGAISSVLVRALRGGAMDLSNKPRPWRSWFAVVTALAVAPLLFVGGLVTSSDSGMAVPDWPTTFGGHMFFYPMGRETDPSVYLEHTHRLFGTLVGLSSLVLMVWALFYEPSRWARRFTVVVFALVVTQGLLGGMRVRIETLLAGDDPAAAARVGRLLAMIHGVLAQLVFGCVVAAAAYLSPMFQRGTPPAGIDPKQARRLKALSTALLHTLIIQLIFGAMARHFRGGNHALWTHAGFSIVVLICATLAGFAMLALPRTPGTDGGGRMFHRIGVSLVVIVILQFLLGWAAFLVRGANIRAESTHEALLRTAHQANGAALLAVTALAFVWSRWLWRAVRAARAGAVTEQPSIPAQPAGAIA